ncbi:MAG: Maf family protein [Pseudomonadota bacterium]
MTSLILASTSPRRAELLRQIGVRFVQHAVDVDESAQPGEMAAHTALRLARLKAQAAMQQAPEGQAVLAADTLIGLDGEALGKPHNPTAAWQMLHRLSGRQHEVYTGVALAAHGELRAFLSLSHVSFRPLDDADIRAYIQSGEPLDKAGGYAIQGMAAAFITRLEGSYSGVMGLPLFETAELLRQAGLPIWNTAP